MRRILFSLIIISLTLITTPAFAAKTNILLGQDYFQTTQHAIQEAKESIYVAMYLINVEPAPTDNPASIGLEVIRT